MNTNRKIENPTIGNIISESIDQNTTIINVKKETVDTNAEVINLNDYFPDDFTDKWEKKDNSIEEEEYLNREEDPSYIKNQTRKALLKHNINSILERMEAKETMESPNTEHENMEIEINPSDILKIELMDQNTETMDNSDETESYLEPDQDNNIDKQEETVPDKQENNIKIKPLEIKIKKTDIISFDESFHENINYIVHLCKQCNYKTKQNSKLKRHIKSIHKDCSENFDRILKDKNVKYTCKDCNISFKQKNNLDNHKEAMHENNKYYCGECNYIGKSSYNLYKHSIVHAGIFYNCQKCDYRTKWKQQLRIHDESSHQGVFYSCDKCDYRAKFKVHLKTHINSDHDNIFFYCHLCSHKVKHKGNLKNHMKNNHEGTSYNCDQCDYETKQRKKLKVHINRIHKGVHFCNHCDYKTNKRGELKVHFMSIHEGYHRCDHCEYKTKNKNNMTKHIGGVHQKITYPCGKCQYKATRKVYLRKHIQIMHSITQENLSYSCDYKQCTYKSLRKANLKFHVKNMHLKNDVRARIEHLMDSQGDDNSDREVGANEINTNPNYVPKNEDSALDILCSPMPLEHILEKLMEFEE